MVEVVIFVILCVLVWKWCKRHPSDESFLD